MPRPGEIGIAMKATTRVEVRAQGTVTASGTATATGSGTATSTAPAPEPPPIIVPMQGAAVVEFFGISLEGVQDVVFVLDCSGSMADLARGRIAEIGVPAPPPPPPVEAPPADGLSPPPVDAAGSASGEPPPAEEPVTRQPRKIDVAQVELVDALERLPLGTRMNVIFFNRDLEAFAPGMVPLDEPGRAGLIGFIRETEPTGSTALAPAMRTAFLLNARRIVLLSDGLGNVGGNADAVLRDAREAMRGGVRIDTIGLGSTQNAALLQTLARESGGLYQPL